MRDLRYLNAQDKFLLYSYLALKEHFFSRVDFDNYFNAIRTDDKKNLFLETASYYLALVKKGDWVVDMPGSDRVVDYFTNTYK